MNTYVTPRINRKVRSILKVMESNLRDSGKIIISAPEIGHFYKMFILNSDNDYLTYINPEIMDYDISYGIKVRWLDSKFESHTGIYEGELSDLIKKCCDYLNG